jgi:hypothetical protein
MYAIGKLLLLKAQLRVLPGVIARVIDKVEKFPHL